MTNKNNTTLYVGVTNDLIRRVWEHKHDLLEGFTKRYHLHKLVYFEQTERLTDAIAREKQLKNWHKDWKINLIKTMNPEWKDLYEDLL